MRWGPKKKCWRTNVPSICIIIINVYSISWFKKCKQKHIVYTKIKTESAERRKYENVFADDVCFCWSVGFIWLNGGRAVGDCCLHIGCIWPYFVDRIGDTTMCSTCARLPACLLHQIDKFNVDRCSLALAHTYLHMSNSYVINLFNFICTHWLIYRQNGWLPRARLRTYPKSINTHSLSHTNNRRRIVIDTYKIRIFLWCMVSFFHSLVFFSFSF